MYGINLFSVIYLIGIIENIFGELVRFFFLVMLKLFYKMGKLRNEIGLLEL